jgi:hypothetical protein
MGSLALCAADAGARSASWIVWWSLYTVAPRVLIISLYNNTGKCVFGPALLHAFTNVSGIIFAAYDDRISRERSLQRCDDRRRLTGTSNAGWAPTDVIGVATDASKQREDGATI